MKALALAVMVVIMPLFANAQYKISGTVTNENGEALIGANVFFEKTFQGAITDISGRFEIPNIHEGNHEILASYMGYETLMQEINLQEDTEMNFPLTRANVLAEEVIVSATRAGDRSPLAYSNISRDEIRERNMGQDIPILLGLTPSIVTTSDAGAGIGYTSFRIRGSDMNRINVTINGVPLNDSESHGVWWVDLPDFAASVDNVQIQRGVGSSTNGGSAFGASMNFETFTKNPESYGELSAAAGSFNSWKTSLSVGTGMLNDKFTLDMRLSKIKSDGYIDRAFSDLNSFSLSGAWYGKKSLLKFNLISGQEKTYQAWGGVPSVRLNNDLAGMMQYEDHYLYTPQETAHMIASDPRTYNIYTYDNETDNYQQDHYQLFYSRELTRQLVFNMGLHYTHGEGYYEQYKPGDDLLEYGIDDVVHGTDTISSTDIIRQKWLDNDFYGMVWSLTYRYGRINAHFGGGWNTYDGSHFGKVIWARDAGDSEINHEWYRSESLKRDLNTYMKVNYRASNRLNLYGDIQYRGIGHEITGDDDDLRDISQEHTYNFLNPKAGLTLDITNRQRLAASVSIGNREPNRSNFVDADPSLPAPVHETMIDYEFSYRLKSVQATLETNLYFMDYNNQLVLTGEINDVGNPVMRNMKDSYRAGIEIVAGIIPLESLRWDLNLTLSRNRIRNYTDFVDDWDNWGSQISLSMDETDISFSPSIVGGSNISYELLDGVNLSLLSKLVGKQYIDNSGSDEHILDPYLINDVQILYSVNTNIFEELSFHILLNNILNTEYESNAWIYKYYLGGMEYKMDGYFPQAGFHFLAGVTVRF
jgi:iron complex outermembrane recepter protein